MVYKCSHFSKLFHDFFSNISAWQLKSVLTTAFQSCLPLALLARCSIIRCRDHHPRGSLMMFVKVHLGESGKSLPQPQWEEPRRCAVRDSTVQNLKEKKDNIKQETGYMNIICQLSSQKKVTIRCNVNWLYFIRIQTLISATFLLVTDEDKELPEGPRIPTKSVNCLGFFWGGSELRNSKLNHRSN